MDPYFQSWLNDPWMRLCGLLATVLFIGSMLFKSEKRVKIGLALGNAFAVYHLWALGSAVAAAISCIAAVRLGLSAIERLTATQSRQLAWAFSGTYALLLLAFYKSPFDLIAFAATLINTWAVFIWTGTRFRAALALAMTLWVLFDFSIQAYEMALSSTLSAIAAIYAWHRLVKK